MKLNADILYERLQRKYTVNLYGESSKKMLLERPELYIDNNLRFHSNHVYLATVEHLPHRPVIERNVVLICIGDNARLSYYKEHATVILIRKKADFFEVYESLQEIYDIFNNWESQILQLFMNSSGIQDFLNISYPVFERPIFVLNAVFQFVASVYEKNTVINKHWRQTQGNLELDAFLTYLHENEMNMEQKGAFLLEFEDVIVLCVNLFDKNGDYIGCLCIDHMNMPSSNGLNVFAEYLATIIEKAYETDPVLINDEGRSLKEILRTLMQDIPLSKNQKILLNTTTMKQSYYCVSAHHLKHFSSLPVTYICSMLETLFVDSIFFEHNNTILGLIPVAAFHDGVGITDTLNEILSDIIEDIPLCVGVSNEFRDLYLLNIYYLQAEAAIENGNIYQPGHHIYLFADFALLEMIANSLGSFPIESYFPKGLAELLDHDKNGGVSYLETLTVFLNENMSYAKAARSLYIHRSTLIERISRIEKELSIDLNNPDQRLQMQMLLKALQIEELLQKQS